ncbi:hypothetical protein CHS0354_035563 [Potamilus streckersoni]|uniref:TIR domain-containing protein n=1 Tax=Potamilus streckersoni TaxID=2493646 RepID=A0AAE0RSU3_9BIVA|nr:hypothetical protein CHS0354_035563 [Potamilus streckersoni]
METDLPVELDEQKAEGTRLTPPFTIDEGVTAKKKSIFKAFRNTITKLNKLSNLWKKDGNWIEDLRNCFSVLFTEASAIKSLGHLVCTSNTLSLLCKVVKDGWNKYYEDKEMTLTAEQFEVIRLGLQNLVIFSDGIEEVRCKLAEDKEFLSSLTKILKSCFEPDILEGEKLTKEKSVVRNSLCILCNISQVEENVKVLQGLKNVGIITLYLDTVFRFVALAYLANVIKEDEIAELHGKDRAFDPMTFLSDLLSSTLKDMLHQCKDESGIAWSAQECALIILFLARNEKSKRILAKVDCLHHLVELARGGTLDEQKDAVGAIWALTFDKETQKMMLEDKTLNIFSMLLDLTKSLDCIRTATEGTLWLFRNELAQDEAYKDVLKDRSVMQSSDELERSHAETDVHRNSGHVMISYSINHREIATSIRDQLVANGYPVWMDIGNMGGSVAQTMAEAIESSHVFLFCCSRGYKNNSSCRLEADYESSRDVQMIPLLMENGYKPDG